MLVGIASGHDVVEGAEAGGICWTEASCFPFPFFPLLPLLPLPPFFPPEPLPPLLPFCSLYAGGRESKLPGLGWEGLLSVLALPRAP